MSYDTNTACRRKDRAHTMHEGQQPLPTNSDNHDQLLPSGMGLGRGAGPGENPARVLPTALAGPAQQGREPSPILLPRIAIGRAVAPHIPACFTSVAAASQHLVISTTRPHFPLHQYSGGVLGALGSFS